MSDTPISDSTPHNVADLGMRCRWLERQLNAANERIKQLEQENDALRADLLLWDKAGIGFTTEDKP